MSGQLFIYLHHIILIIMIYVYMIPFNISSSICIFRFYDRVRHKCNYFWRVIQQLVTVRMGESQRKQLSWSLCNLYRSLTLLQVSLRRFPPRTSRGSSARVHHLSCVRWQPIGVHTSGLPFRILLEALPIPIWRPIVIWDVQAWTPIIEWVSFNHSKTIRKFN